MEYEKDAKLLCSEVITERFDLNDAKSWLVDRHAKALKEAQ